MGESARPRIGRYEVLDHLASGGIGQVYLARTTGSAFVRQVVIKTLDAYRANDAVFVEMFMEEARLLGGFHHRCIPTAYEFGYADNAGYYVVMDYVHGETADAVFHASVERGAPLPLAFGCSVVSSVASALHYAHSARSANGESLGIVHRDVSLSNVMVGHDGTVKLIDFGVAKLAGGLALTLEGALKGKLGYLAPEMILHTHVDHRADIFALGIVLYELTTTTRAFDHESPMIALERVVEGVIAPPSQVVANYPADLEAIVMKALSVDPARRFATAAELGSAVEAVAKRLGFALDHAPVIDVMARIFGKSRRRIARASEQVHTGEREALARTELAAHALDEQPTQRDRAFLVDDEQHTHLDRTPSVVVDLDVTDQSAAVEGTNLYWPVAPDATDQLQPFGAVTDRSMPVVGGATDPFASAAELALGDTMIATAPMHAAPMHGPPVIPTLLMLPPPPPRASIPALPPRALIPAPPPRALIPPSPPRALMPPVGLPLTQAVSPVPTNVTSNTPQGATRMWWLWLLLLCALAGAAAFGVTMLT